MTRIDRDGEGFVVPAPLLAQAFALSETEVKAAMRDGALTTRCEAGVGEDAGRWRLTFLHRNRALRLIVDDQGYILKRGSFPVRSRMARPEPLAGRRSR